MGERSHSEEVIDCYPRAILIRCFTSGGLDAVFSVKGDIHFAVLVPFLWLKKKKKNTTSKATSKGGVYLALMGPEDWGPQGQVEAAGSRPGSWSWKLRAEGSCLDHRWETKREP